MEKRVPILVSIVLVLIGFGAILHAALVYELANRASRVFLFEHALALRTQAYTEGIFGGVLVLIAIAFFYVYGREKSKLIS